MKRFEKQYEGQFVQFVYDDLIYISTTALPFIKNCDSLKKEWDYMKTNGFTFYKGWITKDKKYKITMWKYEKLANTYVVSKRDNKTEEIIDYSIDSQYNIFFDFGDLITYGTMTVGELVGWVADSGYDNIFSKPKWTAHIFGRKCVPLYQDGKLVGHIAFEITRPNYIDKKEAQVRVYDVVQGGALPECRKGA